MNSKRRSSRASGTSATAGRAAPAAPRRSRPTSTKSPGSRRRSKATSTSGRATSSLAPGPTAQPHFHFVGGKGGVGKTTCAAALAAAAAGAGRRVLVVSTDPASSLADVFGLRGRRSPSGVRAVPGAGNRLFVLEVDAAGALERWLSGRRAALHRIAVRGTWLDDEDVARLLRLSLPGIDEIAALVEVSDAGRDGRYDLVVVDTAPTGHTLRMFALPETLQAVARVFAHMQAKHRTIVEALTGSSSPDADDAAIDAMWREGACLAALLRDRSRTGLSWISLPEPMAVEEAADAIAALGVAGVHVDRLVVNRATPPARACGRCRAQRAFEATAMRMLGERIPDVPLAVVADTADRPRTLRALRAIGLEIRRGLQPAFDPEREESWRAGDPVGEPALPAAGTASLMLFGGKGGVGKTTCAAAVALHEARCRPNGRVLLLSVDPAHSLSDVFGLRVGDDARSLPDGPPNLAVRELDSLAAFAGMRARYAGAIDALFDRLSRGSRAVDLSSDRTIMKDLLELAPPGIDELVAIVDVIDALAPDADERFDVVVVDTAPTGHALRLLETPAVVQAWVKALMAIVLKYRAVTGIGDLGELLLKVSKSLGRLRATLVEPDRARFVVVSRAGALERAETGRLIPALRAMGIGVAAMVVNAFGRGSCGRCRRALSGQRRELSALRRLAAGVHPPPRVFVAPAALPAPHGVGPIEAWSARWRASAALSSGSRS